MIYRVVTGWYPSKNTADKVLKKVRSVYPFAKCFAESVSGSSFVYYVVEIDRYTNCGEATIAMRNAINKRIFCGVEAVQISLNR